MRTILLTCVCALLIFQGADARDAAKVARPSGLVEGELGAGYFGQIDRLATLPSEYLVAIVEHSRRVSLWNGTTGERKAEFPSPAEEIASPESISFLPGRDSLMAVSNTGIVRSWNFKTLEPGVRYQMGADFTSPVGLSENGSYLWIRSFEGSEIHNISSLYEGDLEGVHRALTLKVRNHVGDGDGGATGERVFFSPDGRHFLRTRDVDSKGIASLSKVTGGEVVRRFEVPFQVRSAAFTPDGRVLVTGTYGGEVDAWDLSTGRRLRGFAGQDARDFRAVLRDGPDAPGVRVEAISIAPGGKRLAAGRGAEVHVWDVESGEDVASFDGEGKLIIGLGFVGPEGEALAMASWAKLWIRKVP